MQAYANLPQVINHQNKAMVSLSFLDITDFGVDNEWILNKDIEDPEQSITSKQAQSMVTKMIKMFKNSPKKKHLGVFFIASHGMIHEGSQRILLNEFDK